MESWMILNIANLVSLVISLFVCVSVIVLVQMIVVGTIIPLIE
jgi:hypothetical protein